MSPSDSKSSAKLSTGAVASIIGTALLGFGVVAMSYWFRNHDQWASDASMTVGFSFLLVVPIVYLTQKIESRSDKKIEKVREEIAEEVGELKRSIAESQQYVSEKLHEQANDERDRIAQILTDTSHKGVLQALQFARELDLLSPIGVRADAISTDFWLRLQLAQDEVVIHLDTITKPSTFRYVWTEDKRFEDVMLDLAAIVKKTAWWPGEARWNFEGALAGIVDVFVTALRMRSKGLTATNVVQLIDHEWILSDWDARTMKHDYQILYSRLDEVDWHDQMRGKSWLDPGNIGIALETAEVIRELAIRHDLDALIRPLPAPRQAHNFGFGRSCAGHWG